MAQLNTFADVILHQNNGQPLLFSNTGVIHGQVMLGAGVALLTFPNPLATIDSAQGFVGRSAAGVPFLMGVGGTYQLGQGVNFQIDINSGAGLSPAIASTGLVRSPLVSGGGLVNDNFYIAVEGMWDPTSTNIRGITYGWVGPTNLAQAAVVLSTAATLGALQFNIAITITNPNAANSFQITEFSVDLT